MAPSIASSHPLHDETKPKVAITSTTSIKSEEIPAVAADVAAAVPASATPITDAKLPKKSKKQNIQNQTKETAQPMEVEEEPNSPVQSFKFSTDPPSEVSLLLGDPEDEAEKKISEEQEKGRKKVANERIRENKPVSLLAVSKETVQIHEGANLLHRSKFIPIRLTAEDRDLLSILEGTLEISEYVLFSALDVNLLKDTRTKWM